MFSDDIWAEIGAYLSEESKNKCATANLPAPFAQTIRATRVMHSALIRAEIDDIILQFRATDAMLTSAKNKLSEFTEIASNLRANGVIRDPFYKEGELTPTQQCMLDYTESRISSVQKKMMDLRARKLNLRQQHMMMMVMKASADSEATMDDCDDDTIACM